MNILSLTVVEISLTKNLERKKKEQTKGKTNRRMPICNPTIQFVIVDLYTKYEVSILNGCGDIFDEKFGKKEKGTNTRKNKSTASGAKYARSSVIFTHHMAFVRGRLMQ